MKERPILFSGEMVRAIIEGSKTQTRRVIKEKDNGISIIFDEENPSPYYYSKKDDKWKRRECPYGQIGDQLWVRETFTELKDEIHYRADCIGSLDYNLIGWKPSIFMPKVASRITLEITNVRVEGIQNISDSDAISEGIREVTKDSDLKKYCIYDKCDYSSVAWSEMPRSAKEAFSKLWNSINEKSGYGWNNNPWVWVIEFKIVK